MVPGRRTKPYTYLHGDAVIDGDMSVEGRVRIDGILRGSLRAGGVVEVAPGGRIERGPVHAADVRVAGTVVADVHASGRVEIWAGGVIDGDVHAASLDVERGARFRGRSVMRGDEGEPASPRPEAAPPIDAHDLARLTPVPTGGREPVT